MTAITAQRSHANPTRFIVQACCDDFAIHEKALRSKSRTATIALARQTAMFLLRQFTRMSLPEIAREFDKLNHCTVIHACKAVASAAQTDKCFHRRLDELILKCNKEFAA